MRYSKELMRQDFGYGVSAVSLGNRRWRDEVQAGQERIYVFPVVIVSSFELEESVIVLLHIQYFTTTLHNCVAVV